MQEHWTDAYFRRDGGVNYFSVLVTNAKGSTFGIEAHSASKNTGSWAGSYRIYSDGYRMCPPPVSASLTLRAGSGGKYTGKWSMKVADDDENDSGRLTGDVTGTVSDGVLTLTISRINVAGGNYGCMFNQGTESCPVIASGSVIARITKSGASYSIRPVGNMTKYLTDLGGLLTITKTK